MLAGRVQDIVSQFGVNASEQCMKRHAMDSISMTENMSCFNLADVMILQAEWWCRNASVWRQILVNSAKPYCEMESNTTKVQIEIYLISISIDLVCANIYLRSVPATQSIWIVLHSAWLAGLRLEWLKLLHDPLSYPVHSPNPPRIPAAASAMRQRIICSICLQQESAFWKPDNLMTATKVMAVYTSV